MNRRLTRKTIAVCISITVLEPACGLGQTNTVIESDLTVQGSLTVAGTLAMGTGGSPITPWTELANEENSAPFTFGVGGAYFGGVKDDVLIWGFNCAQDGSQLVTGVPKLNMQIESDVNGGDAHWMEFNTDFIDPTGSIRRRYAAFQVDRDHPDDYAWWRFSIAGAGTFSITRASDGATLASIDSNGNLSTSNGLGAGYNGPFFGDAFTVGIPEAPFSSLCIRNSSGDDVAAWSANGNQIDISAVADSNAGYLTFSTQTEWVKSERMRIQNDGHVGIASTNSTQAFLTIGSGNSPSAAVAFAYDNAGEYPQFISTTHNTTPDGNRIEFYTSDGTPNGQFPQNAILGLSVENGSISTPSLRVTAPTIPASATDPGTPGQIGWDTNYVYICIAPNQWKRAQLSSW
jgi:hypothetical protein